MRYCKSNHSSSQAEFHVDHWKLCGIHSEIDVAPCACTPASSASPALFLPAVAESTTPQWVCNRCCGGFGDSKSTKFPFSSIILSPTLRPRMVCKCLKATCCSVMAPVPVMCADEAVHSCTLSPSTRPRTERSQQSRDAYVAEDMLAFKGHRGATCDIMFHDFFINAFREPPLVVKEVRMRDNTFFFWAAYIHIRPFRNEELL